MSGQSIRIGRHDSCDGLPRVITLSETQPDAGAGRALERPRTPLHVTAADAPRRYRRTLCGSYLRAASTSHHLRRARLGQLLTHSLTQVTATDHWSWHATS
jgi:hypothetical protein